jgi:hypothetical protein
MKSRSVDCQLADPDRFMEFESTFYFSTFLMDLGHRINIDTRVQIYCPSSVTPLNITVPVLLDMNPFLESAF